ncbi:MAG: hypothetical protein ACI9DG_000251 [Oleispira sp.]
MQAGFDPPVLTFKYDTTENEVNNESVTREISMSTLQALTSYPNRAEQVLRFSNGSVSGFNPVQGKRLSFFALLQRHATSMFLL